MKKSTAILVAVVVVVIGAGAVFAVDFIATVKAMHGG